MRYKIHIWGDRCAILIADKIFSHESTRNGLWDESIIVINEPRSVARLAKCKVYAVCYERSRWAISGPSVDFLRFAERPIGKLCWGAVTDLSVGGTSSSKVSVEM